MYKTNNLEIAGFYRALRCVGQGMKLQERPAQVHREKALSKSKGKSTWSFMAFVTLLTLTFDGVYGIMQLRQNGLK